MDWLADNWLFIVLILCCGGMMFFMHGGQSKSYDKKDRHQ